MSRFPDRRYFTRVANETGFRAGPLETVFRLVHLLGEVVADHGEELSLRGGTALNLLHLGVPRLSVDVDLDFVGSADAEEAQRIRPGLLAQIASLARAAGYEVFQERPSYAMAHLRLGYRDAGDLAGYLKLDVNFLDRVPVLPTTHRPLSHPFSEDLATVDVQTLALAELAAGKLIALVRRGLARDLFDIAMLSTLSDMDVERMRTALVVRGAAYPPPSPVDYSVDAVDRVRTTNWRSEVLALCRRPIPVDLDEARTRGAKVLKRAIELTPAHRDFLELLDRGQLQPEALHEPELRDRIALNPGLLWRLRAGADALEER